MTDDQTTDYAHGDGSNAPLYMTNGCCEVTHDYVEDLLVKFGLPAGDFEGGFYPLTKQEERYIGDDLADVADGFGALLGYSALYQGQKYLMPSIELYFGEDGAVTEEDALAYGQALKEEYSERLKAIGGHVFLEENWDNDRHLMQVLIPFDYAFANAKDLDSWTTHLEETLLATDLKATVKPTTSPSP